MTTDTEREALRKAIMAEMAGLCDNRIHRWHGWPGTWEFAEAAIRVIERKARASAPAAPGVADAYRAMQAERTEAARASAGVDAEALYRAWHAVGADVAGLDWGRFIAAIATPTPGERAEVTAAEWEIQPDGSTLPIRRERPVSQPRKFFATGAAGERQPATPEVPPGVERLTDEQRLDWIARQDLDDIVFGLVVDAPNDGEYVVNSGGVIGYGKTLRAAIDAAIAQGAKK